MGDEERRKFIRLDWRLPANYNVINSKKRLSSLTRNIGGGGVSLFTDTRLAPGTILQVSVNFPGRPRPIGFTAEVAWSGALLLASRKDEIPHAFETGVRFIKIKDEDQQYILEHSSKGPSSP